MKRQYLKQRARIVDEFFEQRRLLPHVSSKDLGHMAHPRRFGNTRLQQVRPACDRVQRRSQVVVEPADQRDQQIDAIRGRCGMEPVCPCGVVAREGVDGHLADRTSRDVCLALRAMANTTPIFSMASLIRERHLPHESSC